jgi:hypothetical protein
MIEPSARILHGTEEGMGAMMRCVRRAKLGLVIFVDLARRGRRQKTTTNLDRLGLWKNRPFHVARGLKPSLPPAFIIQNQIIRAFGGIV